jgi:1-deoxy-D-xylulose-5-phosphate synthase
MKTSLATSFSLLDNLQGGTRLHDLAPEQLPVLCEEIRQFLIASISTTGGHIGANLGVIELTVALHRTFDLATDRLVFDTGHQGYTHKLLTGRKHLFPSLNKPGGMSRFLCRAENAADTIDASHAGTAISIASGIATAQRQGGEDGCAVAVVGDGTMVEGMSFEGLNYSSENPLPLVIVINDNGMAIARSVGGFQRLFGGSDWRRQAAEFFQGLGLAYLPVGDGHNLDELLPAFAEARAIARTRAVVVHVKTEKGRGLPMAADHPYKMHFSMPFDPATGKGAAPTLTGRTPANVAGETLLRLLRDGHRFTVLTPGTPYASGLDAALVEFPEWVHDVGMAEQHAVGMACGLLLEGAPCFVCFQTTFLQRAFDQVMHDVCFMDLPVTIIGARSGFAGYDSPTHHGIYDFSYLRAIPNLKIFYAGSGRDLSRMIEARATRAEGPLLILHAYEPLPEIDDALHPLDDALEAPEVLAEGSDGLLLAMPNTLLTALAVRERLAARGVDFGVINPRWLKPLPLDHLRPALLAAHRVVTMEENVDAGGFGSALAEVVVDEALPIELLRSAVPLGFVQAGDKADLQRATGTDAPSIVAKIFRKWPTLA